MLDEIDDIDWASRHHAYGPAVDVPGVVRRLLSNDSETREDALGLLYGNVFHQGTRYRASQLVVPFLVELALDRSVGHRKDIVGLIVHLAVGYPERWLATGFDETGLFSGDTEFAAGRNQFQVDELDVYRAVCRQGAQLLRLVDDDDPTVRHAIAYGLALLPCLGSTSLSAMASLTETETDPQLRANAIISIAVLAQSLGTRAPVDFETLLNSHEPLVRYAAAVGQVRMQGEQAGAAVALLVNFIAEPPTPSLYWNEGDLGAFAALTLAEASDVVSQQAVNALCEELQFAEGTAAERFLEPLLRMLFRDGHGSVPADAHRLSAAQREALESLSRSSTLWTVGGMNFANVSLLLRGYGLPSSRSEMLVYVAE